VRETDGIIMEANKKNATLNLRSEAWVDSGIGQTMFGYAQIPDHEPTKTSWKLAFETENLGRNVESLLTAPASCSASRAKTAAAPKKPAASGLTCV
jgi:hypothetical protein